MMLNKTIVISGASQGLGAALAKIFAKTGAELYLISRSSEKLEEVALECSRLGATYVEKVIADICDRDLIDKFITRLASQRKIDIVIANAGVTERTVPNILTQRQKLYQVFNTNINGVMNLVTPAIPHMKKGSSIIVIGSIAGLLPFPDGPAYSASKACINHFAEALGSNLKELGINVHLVLPGYIKTPLTDTHQESKPFIVSAEKAASIIFNGIQKNQPIIAFPLPVYYFAKLIQLLPGSIRRLILRQLSNKLFSWDEV